MAWNHKNPFIYSSVFHAIFLPVVFLLVLNSPAFSSEEDLFYRRLLCLWNDPQLKCAKSETLNFLRAFPESSRCDPLYTRLGDEALIHHQYSEALAAYEKIRAFPLKKEMILRKWFALYQLKYFDLLYEEISCSSLEEEFSHREGSFYCAEAYFRKALSLKGKRPAVATTLLEKSIPYYLSLSAKPDYHTYAEAALGAIYSLLGEKAKSAQHYLEAAKNDDAFLHLSAARMLASSDAQQALSLYDSLVKKNTPWKEDAAIEWMHLLAGEKEWQKLKNEEKNFLVNLRGAHLALFHFYMGFICSRECRYKEAFSHFQQGMSTENGERLLTEALVHAYAKCAFELGRDAVLAQCANIFQKSFKKKSPWIILLQAQACRKAKQYQKALALLSPIERNLLIDQEKAAILLESYQFKEAHLLLKDWLDCHPPLQLVEWDLYALAAIGDYSSLIQLLQRHLDAFLLYEQFPKKMLQVHAYLQLARISHQHSSQFGQTVLSDTEENPEGRVKLTLPRDALKADDETDGQSDRMVGEKCGLARVSHQHSIRLQNGCKEYFQAGHLDLHSPLLKRSTGIEMHSLRTSLDSEKFAQHILGFSAEINGQRPLINLKSTKGASKLPEDEGVNSKNRFPAFSYASFQIPDVLSLKNEAKKGLEHQFFETYSTAPPFPTQQNKNGQQQGDLFNMQVEYAPRLNHLGYVFKITLSLKPGCALQHFHQKYLFLIDRSNSIPRTCFLTNKKAIYRALESISLDETFNIFLFDHKVAHFSEQEVPGTPENCRQGQKFIESQSHGGYFATADLLKSLTKIIPISSRPDELNTIILLSDGDVFLNIEQQRQIIRDLTYYNGGKASLFSIASGKRNHFHLLNLLSSFNKGTLIATSSQFLEERILQLMQAIQKPIGKEMHAAAVVPDKNSFVRLQPKNSRLPELYKNRPFVLYGCTNKLEDFILFLQGDAREGLLDIKKNISFSQARMSSTSSLEKEWAQLLVQEFYEDFFNDGKQVHLEAASQFLSPFNLTVPFLHR